MKRILGFLALSSMVSLASPTRAEEGDAPRARVMLDVVDGLTGEAPTVDAIVRSMILSGGVRLAPGLTVTAFVPYTHASVRTNGVVDTRQSIGNVGAAVEKDIALGAHENLGLELLFTAPTAGGDPLSPDRSKREKAALGELSSAIRSFEDDAFFAARRAAIVPRVTFSTVRAGWAFSAYGKLPILIRAGGEDPVPFASTKVRSAAFEAVVAAQVLRHFGDFDTTRGLAAAFGPRLLFVGFLDEPIDDPALPARTPTQVAFEWVTKLRLGPVLANLGVLVPLGGRADQSYPNQHAFRVAVGAQF